LLKNARLAEIAEAIADKLEAERKYAECDMEHNQVKGEIESITADLNIFREATINLEEVKSKHNNAESEHTNWLAQSASEVETLSK
jgi:hypothetical protein